MAFVMGLFTAALDEKTALLWTLAAARYANAPSFYHNQSKVFPQAALREK
jgi:hypothetical protein